MIAVLVCGGRDFADREFVHQVLDHVDARRRIMLLVHGAAPGADSLAEQWALARDINVARNPARWRELGPAAGPIRNQEMLDLFRPKGVVAFPGGAGTADMIRRARAAGVPIYQPPYPPPG